MTRTATSVRMAAAAMTLAVLAAPTALAGSASATTPADTVIAADTTSASPATPVTPPTAPVSRVVGIDASIVNGLVVTGAKGSPGTLAARGEKTRTLTPKGTASVVFRQLTPGVTYTVAIGGTKVGTGVPVAAVAGAYGLTVSTTGTPDEVLLRWNHTPAQAQGSIGFDVTATPIAAIGRASSAPVISGSTTATVTTMALDPNVKYTLSVTPRNSASTGQATAATMTRTLAEMGGASSVPTTPAPAPAAPTPAPAPAPTPAADPGPAPAPAPAPGPSTKTIYVCPADATPNGELCRKVSPYTWDLKAYTYHAESYTYTAYGPAYTVSTGQIGPGPTCASGWYPAWDTDPVRGSVNPHCEQTRQDPYIATGTRDVKDAIPAGYTDTGSAWTKKNTPPAGYSDDGTAWVIDLPKVATVVPA